MWKISFAGFAMLAAVSASAEDTLTAPAQSGPVRQGWSAAAMVTYMKPDTSRCNVEDGEGGSLLFGYRGELPLSVEAWVQMVSLPHGGCTYYVPGPTTPDPTDDERQQVNEPPGTVDLNGGGVGLMFGYPFENRFLARIFGVVGVGVLRRAGHPQYPDPDFTTIADIGAGYLQPFELFGREMNVRGEMRYRFDFQTPPHPTDQDPPPDHSYDDMIFNLGLQVPLSRKPEPPAPQPEPVAVVPVADQDGDGVPDTTDQCPDTAAGTTVSDTGCEPPPPPQPAPQEVTLETAKAGDTVVLHGVNFETASARLTTNAQTLLAGVADQLGKRAELRVEIGGHTDARGSDTYNQSLSEQRAQSVMTYLIEKGVDAARLSAVGYGEAQPVDNNETDEGMERNRRVELKILE